MEEAAGENEAIRTMGVSVRGVQRWAFSLMGVQTRTEHQGAKWLKNDFNVNEVWINLGNLKSNFSVLMQKTLYRTCFIVTVERLKTINMYICAHGPVGFMVVATNLDFSQQ